MNLMTGSPLEILFIASLFFILTLIAILFSPLGIGFIIFSLLRNFSKNNNLIKISFIFQIAITVLTFISGIATTSIFIIANYYSFYAGHLFVSISIILGTIFATLIEAGVIIVQGNEFRKKNKK